MSSRGLLEHGLSNKNILGVFSLGIGKVISIALSFLVNILIARSLGVEGIGQFNLTITIVNIGAVFCLFGLSDIVIREVAIGTENKNWSDINGLTLSAIKVVLFTSSFLLALALISKYIFAYFLQVNLWYILFVYFIVLFRIVTRVYSSSLYGILRPITSYYTNEIVALILFVIGVSIMIKIQTQLSLFIVLLIYLLGRIVAYLFTYFAWMKLKKSAVATQYSLPILLKKGFPLLVVAGGSMLLLSVDALMIGAMCSSVDLGLYTTASKIALTIPFLIQIMNSIYSPRFAKLYSASLFNELKILFIKIFTFFVFISLLVITLIYLFSELALSLWGSQFVQAKEVLYILAIGQIINLLTASTGSILTMSGRESILGWITFFGVILNFTLNYLLIPRFGILGGATATTITLSLMNVLKAYRVKKILI